MNDQPLNARQETVLLHVARGRTNKEIGRALGYHPQGIYMILSAARAKLGARNRAHAAALWIVSTLPEPLASVWTARLSGGKEDG